MGPQAPTPNPQAPPVTPPLTVDPAPAPEPPRNPNQPVTPPGYVPATTPPNFGTLPQPDPNTPQPNITAVGGNPPAPQTTPTQPDPQQTPPGPTNPNQQPPTDPQQQQTPPPTQFMPVVTLADGSQVPINQYRVQLDNGNEVPFTDMVRSQNDLDQQINNLRTESQRVQQWEQSLQQNPYGQPQQMPQQPQNPQGAPQYTQQQPQYPHQQVPQQSVIDPNTLGEYATDGERSMAHAFNQYAQNQNQQNQALNQRLDQNNNLLEQQYMMGELRRASDSYGVPQDDLVREWERTQVNNFDTLGEIIQLRRQMEGNQAQQTLQNAQQVTQSVGVGPGQVNPHQQTTPTNVPGRGVVDYRNAPEVLRAYDLDPSQMNAETQATI